jgi:hypothetical protein
MTEQVGPESWYHPMPKLNKERKIVFILKFSNINESFFLHYMQPAAVRLTLLGLLVKLESSVGLGRESDPTGLICAKAYMSIGCRDRQTDRLNYAFVL